MASLILAFEVVFPLFALMSLGFCLRNFNVADEAFLRKINSLMFKVCLPCVMFLSIYSSDYSQDFSLKLVITAICLACLNGALLLIIVPRIEPENEKRGVMIQGMFRSNFILFGLPVAQTIYGEAGMAVTAILISIIVPILNGFCVFVLELYSGKSCNFLDIIKSLLKNPIIVAAIIGYVGQIVGLQLPYMITDVLQDLANVATPMALMALGGTFYFSRMGDAWRQLLFCVAGRLILIPIIGMSIAVYLGFRDAELVALFCMLASPTAVSSYTMAQSAGADAQLAGQIVVMTSLCAVGSIFLWVSVLGHVGLI